MNGSRSSWTQSFGYAFRGIAYAIRHEAHMRFHLAAAAIVAALGIWLRISRGDWLWLGAAVACVWTAELMNTAVERAVDFASPQRHPLAGAAKDAAAGAVLVMAIFSVIVGMTVLGPPLWRVLFGS